MTAFFSLPYADRVELLTDGATCFPSGKLLAKINKAVLSPHVPMAVTGRGNHGDLRAIADTIVAETATGSFDNTIAALVDLLDAGAFQKRSRDFEVVIAGMSETNGPSHFIFKSIAWPASPYGDLQPFTLVNWGDMPLVGAVDLELDDLPGVTRASFERGLADVGIPLFEAMRRKSRGDTPDTAHAHWVGAHIDHTIIDASGARTARIHEWPEDRLFELIEP